MFIIRDDMKDRVFVYLTALKNTERRYNLTIAGVAVMFNIDIKLAAQYVAEWIHEQIRETLIAVE